MRNDSRLCRSGKVDISRRAAAIMTATSVPVVVLALVAASAMAAALHPDIGRVGVVEIGLPLFVGVVVAPLAHEAVHAGAFLALGGHPRFGFRRSGPFPFFTVSCAGRLFPPMQFIGVGLAPLVLLDLLAVGLLTSLHTTGLGIGIIAINTAGSVGDIWLSGIVLTRPRWTRWEAVDGHFISWTPMS